jgi:RimJ/RimL family protein N-acetyltransferase
VLRPDYPIQTDRLTVRPFQPDDLDALSEIQSRPEITRFLYWEPRDREQVRPVLDDRIRRSTLDGEGQTITVAVVWRETGALVGDVNLYWISEAHRAGEIGFVFHPGYQGRGFATEAAEVMLRLGFEGLGLHRIIGRLDGRNQASARVLEKLGMRREAHFVENEYVKGEWTDEVVYAILDREWRAQRGDRR